MIKKKKEMLLTVIALLSLVVITVGVTFAFFNYTKEGTTENTVTTGSITFLYTETSGVGRGISLTNAFPISDEVGKNQVGEGNVFDFKVTSNTPNRTAIPYEITARKNSDSTLDESAVKLYLTKVNSDIEEEVLLLKYSNLTPTAKVDSAKYTEKTIYTGKVPANSTNYEQAFKLRMWIDEETDFSPNEDGTYPYNGKTFTVTVNVYANAKIVTDSDIALEKSTSFSSITVDGVEATAVSGKDYDYETILPVGTTSTTINIETESPYATVNVERLDSLAYSSNIKRLSASKTLDLNPGDNYFKITVTSENKEESNYFILNIIQMIDGNCNLNQSWNFDYTNDTQKFKIYCAGNYKIETWGGQGATASSEYDGGYGAYATGTVKLSYNDLLYINVAGSGNNLIGGYNGGGTANTYGIQTGAGGGGATSVATKSGLLSSFENNSEKSIDDIIIVAAGGGGTGFSLDGNYSGIGGSGGGIQGNDGIDPTSWKYYYGTGATQLLGGNSYASLSNIIQSGAFGQGGNGRGDNDGGGGSGGGAGLYGGGGSSRGHGGAGGGSSYIGNSLLTNKVMYCYNCKESDEENTKTISTTNVSELPISNYAKIGDGYARITYLGES